MNNSKTDSKSIFALKTPIILVRDIIACVAAVVVTFSAASTALAAEVVKTSDLQGDAHIAQQEKKPIVLFVTASYCEFCEVLREEIFQFLPDDSRFVLREVVKDNSRNDVKGFQGEQISPSDVADQYGIFLTPTVLFVDSQGRQLSEPMVGVITLDFYNYYFDQAIEQSTQMIRQQAVSKTSTLESRGQQSAGVMN